MHPRASESSARRATATGCSPRGRTSSTWWRWAKRGRRRAAVVGAQARGVRWSSYRDWMQGRDQGL